MDEFGGGVGTRGWVDCGGEVEAVEVFGVTAGEYAFAL